MEDFILFFGLPTVFPPLTFPYLFSFMRSHFLIAALTFFSVLLESSSKRSFPCLSVEECSPFHLNFSGSDFMLKSLMYLKLSSVYTEEYWSSLIFLHVETHCSQHHLLMILSSFQVLYFWYLQTKPNTCSFEYSYLGPQFYSTVLCFCFLCQYHAAFISISLWYNLKLDLVLSPEDVILFL